MVSLDLTPERALIFRITHIENLPWILRHGLSCPSSDLRDPGFVTIGNPEIIGKRSSKLIPVSPGGVLEDYVPFYFTPCSVMLYNIVTGYSGMTRRERDDVIVLVSSVRKLSETGVAFVFTDRHALVAYARFFNDVSALDRIDWELLRACDFAPRTTTSAKWNGTRQSFLPISRCRLWRCSASPVTLTGADSASPRWSRPPTCSWPLL